MNKLLDLIVRAMEHNDYVNDDNYEIVRYGLELLVMKAIIYVILLIIGIATKSIFEVVAFMVAYQPLRSYCGGYHAKSRVTCITSSVLMLVSVIVFSKTVSAEYAVIMSIIMMFIGSVTIVLLTPVGTPNKPLDDMEKKVFRKRSLIILAIIWLFAVVMYFIKFNNVMIPVALAVINTAILLIAGKLKQ